MLMIFSVIIYIIKMQIKLDYFQPDNWLLLLGQWTLPRINCVMVHYICVKMSLKSNLS